MRLKKYGARTLILVTAIGLVIVAAVYIWQSRSLDVAGCQRATGMGNASQNLVRCNLRLKEIQKDERPDGGDLVIAAESGDGTAVTLQVASMYSSCRSKSLDVRLNQGDLVEVLATKTGPATVSVCHESTSITMR